MSAVSFASDGLPRERPATLQQYGAVPWRRDRRGRIRVLLVTSSRGRWIAPKGWPVEGRAPYLSAALEAFEEAGVIGEIRSHPLADYQCFKEGGDGSSRRCRVTLFSLRVRGTLTNWPERGRRTRRWFALDEAAEVVDDAELADVLRSIEAAPAMLTEIDRASTGGERLPATSMA
jgi:8-oxo-dGTP pyrophosphatase MutT (NUDIX family)